LAEELPNPKMTLEQHSHRLRGHLLLMLLLLLVIWSVKIAEYLLEARFFTWGLFPRDWSGLIGILTMPFLHKDFPHLYANTFGVFVLGMGLFQFYEKVAVRVLLHSALWGGLLLWLFGRPSYHIGASGVIYSLSAFLFLAGVLRRDRSSIGAALVVSLLFGGSIWGVLPIHPGVSWEGHLFGAIVGCILAYSYRGIDLPPKEVNNDEDSVFTSINPDDVDDVYRDPLEEADSRLNREKVKSDLHFQKQM